MELTITARKMSDRVLTQPENMLSKSVKDGRLARDQVSEPSLSEKSERSVKDAQDDTNKDALIGVVSDNVIPQNLPTPQVSGVELVNGNWFQAGLDDDDPSLLEIQREELQCRFDMDRTDISIRVSAALLRIEQRIIRLIRQVPDPMKDDILQYLSRLERIILDSPGAKVDECVDRIIEELRFFQRTFIVDESAINRMISILYNVKETDFDSWVSMALLEAKLNAPLWYSEIVVDSRRYDHLPLCSVNSTEVVEYVNLVINAVQIACGAVLFYLVRMFMRQREVATPPPRTELVQASMVGACCEHVKFCFFALYVLCDSLREFFVSRTRRVFANRNFDDVVIFFLTPFFILYESLQRMPATNAREFLVVFESLLDTWLNPLLEIVKGCLYIPVGWGLWAFGFAGKTRRYVPPVVLDRDVEIIDNHPDRNRYLVNRFYYGPRDYMLPLYGYVRFRDEQKFLKFPIYCDKKTFLRWYERVFLPLEKEKKHNIRMGVFDASDRELMYPLFAPILHDANRAMLPLPFTPFMSAVFTTVLGGLLGWAFDVPGLHYTILMAGSMFFNYFQIGGDTWAYVLFEETCNGMFGVLPIIAIETSSRLHLHGVQTLIPAFVHLLLSLLPFPVRVVLHVAFNRVVFEYGKLFSCSIAETPEEVAKLVEQICVALDFLNKLRNKDAVGLALSVGMQSQMLVKFYKTIGEEDPTSVNYEELTQVLWEGNTTPSSSVDENGDVDTVLLADFEERNRYSFIFSWIPESIRKSPTFSRISALAIMMMSATYFQSFSTLRKISAFLVSDDFVDGGNLLTTATSAVASFFKGIKRAFEKGDITQFFEMPRDVYFEHAAASLLYVARKKNENVAEVNRLIAEANDLILSRTYANNNAEQNRLVRALREFINGKLEFLRRNSPRKQPIPFFLTGPPGTGKTTIIDSLIDFLAVHQGWERFPGDKLNFDINDKYPISSGINVNAKVLVMNDIPSVYLDFPKMDLLPLDVLLQKILDTYALYFRAAAVEDKGMILNDIKYLIITCNHKSLKCPGETEKLQRRLEYGILVEVGVVVNGKHANYDEFSKLTQSRRNACWRFTILDVCCKDGFIRLDLTQRVLDWPSFILYVMKRVDEYEVFADETLDKFTNANRKCPCGIPHVLHMLPKTRDSFKVGLGDSNDTYKALTAECVPPDEVDWFDPFPAEIYVPNTLASMIDSSMYAVLGLFFVYLYLEHFTGFVLSVAAFSFLLNLETMKMFISFFFKGELDAMKKELKASVVRNDKLWKILEFCYGESDAYYYWQLKLMRQYWKLKMFYEAYGNYILAAAASGALLAYFYSTRKKESELYGTPLYSHQVKPDSLVITGDFREQNFPDVKLKGYGRSAENIYGARIQRLGVQSSDLVRMAGEAVQEYKLEIEDVGHGVIKGLNISPEFVAFNKHWFIKEGKFRGRYFTLELRGVVQRYEVSQLLYTNDVELFLLKHNFHVMTRPLHTFLPNDPIHESVDVVHVGEKLVRGVAHPASFRADRDYQSLEWQEAGVKGSCGEPIVGELHGSAVIVGVVAYGKISSPITGCTLVSRDWFNRVTSQDPDPFVERIELLGIDLEKLGPLSENSEFRNVASPFLQTLGTAPGGTNSFSSKLKQTRLYDDVSPKLSVQYGKPERLSVVLEGVYKSAMTNTFKNVNMQNNLTDAEVETVLGWMLDRMANEEEIKKRGIKLSPMSLDKAFFGDHTINVTRIDFNTSVGPILRENGVKSKYDMFVPLPDEVTEEGDQMYELHAFVRELIKGYDDNLRQNVLFAVFGDMVGKDEARPIEKLQNAKVRLFCVLCAALNVYVRMYIMPIIQYLLNSPELSECYGGMNAGSMAWNDLAARLLRPGSLFFDMDFNCFDTSHDAIIFRACARFFSRLGRRLGYTEVEEVIVYLLVLCFKYQIMRWMRDYILKKKGMPSGCVFTLAMNSFVNSFLLRVAYLRLVGNSGFDQKVRTANVGDDNINSVDAALISRFNMVTISTVYTSLGYIATPAAKGNKVLEHIPFEDLQFVKRKFRWNDETKCYLAPLEMDSIYKSFCFEFKDAGVSSAERLRGISTNAQREVFLHGREAFCKFQKEMAPIYAKYQLIFPLLDFDELLNEFKENQFRTYL